MFLDKTEFEPVPLRVGGFGIKSEKMSKKVSEKFDCFPRHSYLCETNREKVDYVSCKITVPFSRLFKKFFELKYYLHSMLMMRPSG